MAWMVEDWAGCVASKLHFDADLDRSLGLARLDHRAQAPMPANVCATYDFAISICCCPAVQCVSASTITCCDAGSCTQLGPILSSFSGRLGHHESDSIVKVTGARCG